MRKLFTIYLPLFALVILASCSSDDPGKKKSTEAKITSFSVNDIVGTAVITDNTVSATVKSTANLASLTPTFTVSTGATASITSGTATDFTSPVDIIVTAEDGVTKKTYTVTVTQQEAPGLNLNAEDGVNAFSVTYLGGSASVVENPVSDGIDTSAKVFKLSKATASQDGLDQSLALVGVDLSVYPMDIADGKKIKIKYLNPNATAGSIQMKMEYDGGDFKSEIIPTTKLNEWETLTFDFSSFDFTGKTLTKLTMSFDYGNGDISRTFYLDDLQQFQ